MTASRAVCVIIVGLTSLPRPAATQQMDLEVGLLGGYGLEDPYRVGVGATAGVLESGIYAGGVLVRHFGTSSTRILTTETTTTDQSAWIFGGELGIPLPVEPVEVRLSVVVGITRFRANTVREPADGSTPTEETNKATKGLVSPRASALVPLPGFKVGAEIALLIGGDPGFSETFSTRSVAFYAKVVVPIRP